MKKIYGFLGAMALFAMASCSDDNGVTPDVPGNNGGVKGDLYMTMNITQASTLGSRADGDTQTPNQGVEVGIDDENTISTALIIFAEPSSDSNDYDVKLGVPVGVATTGGNVNSNNSVIPGGQTGNNTQNLAVFEVDRTTMQGIVGTTGSKDLSIFVIANPTQQMVDNYSGVQTNKKLQSTFELANDGETYWTARHFLMSNKTAAVKNIPATELATGTHTTASTALDLGTVYIQRAMSRFDIDVTDGLTNEKKIYTITNTKTAYSVEIELDAVALVNQATSANLFKVTGTTEEKGSKNILFNDETETNWVWSPTQTAFTLPLFKDGANASVDAGLLKGNSVDLSTLSWTSLASLSREDNVFTHPTNQPASQGYYKYWRYAMENTNPDDAQNQLNGNSTGVVFRAIMKSSKAGEEQTSPVYSYNNVILGSFTDLVAYVKAPINNNEDPGVYDMVQIRWNAAIDAYNADQSSADSKYEKNPTIPNPNAEGVGQPAEIENPKWWGASNNASTLENNIKTYLVQQKFSIFTPTNVGGKQVFYCYYIYWNRHNNNGLETVMGPMEFATVRNNVYKLRVTNIFKLGHPGEPENDPETPDPDDPDEEDHLFLSVDCQVLPWEVRINDIIF